MRRLKAFGSFWYDFVVGEEWRIPLAVLVAFAATAALCKGGDLNAWWLSPPIVVGALVCSVRRAVRERSQDVAAATPLPTRPRRKMP